tara:strand:- start:2784 stop:3869 length:1086 start_codon:yes stop_codon:yes gene_type:complete
MSRAIIQSQKAIVAASNDTVSFKTTNINLNLINNVQNASFSIAFPHQKSKQLGSQNYSIDNTFIQPDVELSLSYIPEPKLQNEINSNFISGGNSYTSEVQALAGSLARNTNFLIINSPDDGKDALDSVTVGGSAVDLNGFEAAAFGNCFLNSYGLTYGVNSLPTVTTTYVASNAKFEKLTGTSMESPAINLVQGNNNNAGLLNFTFENGIKNPKIPTPNDANSSISFENLQVGGQDISGSHLVQSIDMSVALQRVSNYGFGSDFSYDRKAEMPANGSFNISSLVSGYDNGNITGVLDNEETYSFDLVISSTDSKKIKYSVSDARIQSYSSSLPINGIMSFDASFTFPVNETVGLTLSGTAY